MTKRLLYCRGLTLFLAMVLGSCQSEEPANMSGDGTVSFTATLSDAISTRAIGDCLSAKNLACLVYDENGAFVMREDVTMTDLSATVQLKLLKGVTYDIAFFAYHDNDVYAIDHTNGKVTIDYNKMNKVVETAGDEGTVYSIADGDCFYSVKKSYTAGSTDHEDVILTRPVAQVNFGTDDLTGEAIIGKTYTNGLNTQITLDAYSQLNLITGVAEGANTTVNFPLTKVDAFHGEDFPVSPDTYKYVGMGYVLVPIEGCVSDVQLGAFNGNASPSVNAVKVPNAPLKRNFRTNIYGSLITKSSQWNVNINDQWSGTHNITDVPDDATLKAGGFVKVTGSTPELTIPATLDAPLTLSITGSVDKLNIGASDKPVTIIVAKDVKYPAFNFTTGAEIADLTIVGDPTSSEATNDFGFFYDNTLSKPASMKNVTFQGVHFEKYGFNNQYSFGVENLVIDGCVFSNLIVPAVGTQLTGGSTQDLHNKNLTVKNSRMHFADNVGESANGLYLDDMEGEVKVLDNTMNKPGYCGIRIVERSGSKANVTVSGNTIDARKDGIKLENVTGGIMIDNNNVHSLENCIRLKNSVGTNEVTINGNTVDMKDCIAFDGTEPCGILLINNAENAGALVNVSDNILLNDNGHGFSMVNVNTVEGSNTANPFK